VQDDGNDSGERALETRTPRCDEQAKNGEDLVVVSHQV
jgi:hypothetical protein